MARPGFFGRVLEAGGRAMRANLPLIALCAIALTVSQHLLMRMQIEALAQLDSLPRAPASLPGLEALPFLPSSGAVVVSLLQGAVYLFLYIALLFGAHAAILYDPEREVRPGFGHFAYAPGRLGAFFWRFLVVGFRTFLVVLLVGFVGGLLISLFLAQGSGVAAPLTMLLMAAVIATAFVFSLRYSLALPAAVADDADVSVAAAVERARPRLWSMLGATLGVALAIFVADMALGAVLGSGFAAREAPSNPAEMSRMLQDLRGAPTYWIYFFLSAVLSLIGAVYFAAVLSVGYRDATEEGLTLPRAEVF